MYKKSALLDLQDGSLWIGFPNKCALCVIPTRKRNGFLIVENEWIPDYGKRNGFRLILDYRRLR